MKNIQKIGLLQKLLQQFNNILLVDYDTTR